MDTPPPVLIQSLLGGPLAAAVAHHVGFLATSPASKRRYDAKCRRFCVHNDPFLRIVHANLTPLAEQRTGERLRPSYVFAAFYQRGGGVDPHVDRRQCHVTLDYCVSADGAWPLTIEGTDYVLSPNDAILFFGRRLSHWRRKDDFGDHCHMVFFHFVPIAFTGPLA